MADQQDALREAHELLGKVYALMQRGEVGLIHGARGGCWVLPDLIGAWLEQQDALRTSIGDTPAPQSKDGVKACLSPDGSHNRCVLWRCHEAKACTPTAGVPPSAGGQQ